VASAVDINQDHCVCYITIPDDGTETHEYVDQQAPYKTVKVVDLEDFGINGDEQMALHSVRHDGALVFDMAADNKTIASGVIAYPNAMVELALKDGRVLPLSGVQKPNPKHKAAHPSQSSPLSRSTQSSRASSTQSSSWPRSPQLLVKRCAWCDSQEHTKSKCSEFQWAKMLGIVYVNNANRVTYWATRTELPQMIGKGGMRVIYERLAELEEHWRQLCSPRHYDPSPHISILQGVIRSFSA